MTGLTEARIREIIREELARTESPVIDIHEATGGPVFAELAVFTQDQAVRKYQREARVQSLYPATCWPSREHHAAILGSGAVSVALAAASGWTPLGIAATLVVFLALASHARSLPRVQLQRKAVLRHGQRAVSEGSDGRS